MDTDSERVLFGYVGNQPVFIPQETADLMAKNAAEKRLRDRAHEISKRIAWRFERVFFWGLFYPVIWSVLRLGSWVASWFRFATRAKRQMFFIAVGGYGHPTGGDWEIYIASDFDQKEVLDREWGHDGNSPPTLLICVSPDTEGWLVSQ